MLDTSEGLPTCALTIPDRCFQGMNDVMMAHALVSPTVDGVPVRVLNYSDEAVALERAMQIGRLEPISEVMSIVTEDTLADGQGEESVQIAETEDSLGVWKQLRIGARCPVVDPRKGWMRTNSSMEPLRLGEDELDPGACRLDELDSILEPRCVDELGSDLEHTEVGVGRDGNETSLGQSGISCEEIHCLQALVLRYRDAFALNPSELGRTSVLHHTIETRDRGPVAQATRRMPLCLSLLAAMNLPWKSWRGRQGLL